MVPVEGSTTDEKHLGLITPEWQRARAALVIPPGHAPIDVYADGMEVGVARCAAVQMARENKLKFLFFIDWDTLIPPDALLKLVYHLENNPDYDIASGMYVMKSLPTFPLLWRDWNVGVDWDWTLGDVIRERVVGIPMGCCLLRLSLFDKLPHSPENPWFQTVNKPVLVGGQWGKMCMTEDLWFTRRYTEEVDKEHKQIIVDTSVWCDHICHTTGRRYTLGEDSLPMKRLRAKQGPPPAPAPATPKIVLHVGCGTAPLPAGYEGWQEFRLDIDPAVKPDIIASITDLSALKSASVDAIHSSHNLEHLQADQVPLALSEFNRLLKPGGKVLIAVPDVQAVAEAIPRVGLHGVLYESSAGPISPADVLYGLRSAVAGGNQFFRHLTGFTKDTLEEALVKAQFKDITVLRHPDAYSLEANAVRPV